MTWPSNRPAVEGWVGFDASETTPTVSDTARTTPTVSDTARLHRAEIVAVVAGDDLQVRVDMTSPNPEALAEWTRTALNGFRQSIRDQGFMRLLMRGEGETLFEDAQVEVLEDGVRLVTPMTPTQAELMLSYVIFSLSRD